MDRSLFGGQLQRLWVARTAGCDVALFRIRARVGEPGIERGENAHVVLAGGLGVGLVEGEAPERLREAMKGGTMPVQAVWRSKLQGARVCGVGEWGAAFCSDGRSWVARPWRNGLTLTEEPLPDPTPASGSDLAVRAAQIVERLVGDARGRHRAALARALRRAMARFERRVEAVSGDLARARAAETAAQHASLFIPQAATAARGLTKLQATDWSSGEARAVEMALDPARGAKEQIDAVFKRARRLRQGAQIAGERLADARKGHAALAALADELETHDDADLAAIEAKARAAAPRELGIDPGTSGNGPPRERPQERSLPYRTFLGASGARILAGRNAAANDELTCRVARPHDLWLHAKSRAGAHVVVVMDKGTTCAPDVLVEAAHLAAHFSEARDERLVEVQYVPRRYVRKPRGSAPGLVVVEREKVIVLRRDDVVLRRLLAGEIAS
jgi:hypothetical protein